MIHDRETLHFVQNEKKNKEKDQQLKSMEEKNSKTDRLAASFAARRAPQRS